MTTKFLNHRKVDGGIMIAYFLVLLITLSAIAGVGAYVSQNSNLARRRSQMIAAQQYAEAGAVLGCSHLNSALTNRVGTTIANLLAQGYVANAALSTPQTNVYEKTIIGAFTNQPLTARIWMPAAPSPTAAKISAFATTGQVTEQTAVMVKLVWGYPGAIISINRGAPADTSVAKSSAQNGNVVVNGASSGSTVIDGGPGLAILANGRANIDTNYARIPQNSISMSNYNTGDQIPDYTSQGTANSLFDFSRYIAVADLTPNIYNTNQHNNHFTNVNSFANALRIAANHTLEGVVVIDLHNTSSPRDPNWSKAGDASMFPYGINIHGTLFYNFGPEFGPLDKFVVTASLNVNAANLAGLVANNPATYTTGYPPVYTDPTKNPTNINTWAAVPIPYPTFSPADDLPALMYSIGEVDIHGPANVCGVSYTPSYMEIENKGPAGTIQYFKGSLIMGQGIYYENNNASTSIISFDPKAVDNLATLANAGKQVRVAYWRAKE